MDWIVLGGSLAAVLTLAAIAWALGLGGAPALEDSEQAMRIARDAHSGFRPRSALVDAAGKAALVQGENGEIVLLRQHGAQIAARVFKTPPHVEIADGQLRIATGERMFGDVTLATHSAEATDWAKRLEGAGHA